MIAESEIICNDNSVHIACASPNGTPRRYSQLGVSTGTPVPFEFTTKSELLAELSKATPKDGAMRTAIFNGMIKFHHDEKILEEMVEALRDETRRPTRFSELKHEDISPPHWERFNWSYAELGSGTIGEETLRSLTWVVKVLWLQYWDTLECVTSVEVYLSRSGRWYVLRRTGRKVELASTEWRNTHKLKLLIRQLSPKLSNMTVASYNGIVYMDLSSALLEIYAQLVRVQKNTDEERRQRLDGGVRFTTVFESVSNSFVH